MVVTIAKTTRTQRLVVSNTDNNIRNNPDTVNRLTDNLVITNLPVTDNPATVSLDTEPPVTVVVTVKDTRPVTCRLVTDTLLTLTADNFFGGKGTTYLFPHLIF